MKIIQLISGHSWSGGQQQILFLSRGLMERGHEVCLVCQEGSVLASRAEAEGLRVISSPMRLGLDFNLIRLLRRLVVGEGFEIIDAHRPKPLNAALVLCFMSRRARLVATRRVSFPIPSKISALLKYNRFVDGIVAVSEGVRDSLIRRGIPGEKIAVIYGAVDTDRFRPGLDARAIGREFFISSDERVVVVIANYSAWKGQSWLIGLLPGIIDKIGPVKVFLVGLGTDGSEIKSLIERHSLEGVVIGTGFRQDVEHFLAAADLLVCPSLAGEGLTGAVREAMAMKVPVVSTNAGGNSELVAEGRTGYLVPAGEGAAMKEAIIRALKDADRSREMVREAYELIQEKFTIGRMIDQTEDFYREVL